MSSQNVSRIPNGFFTKHWLALVIDDAPEFSAATAVALTLLGGEIAIAGSGAEALTIAQNALAAGSHFDIIFTDIEMPGMDGIMTTRLLRDSGINAPIIAMSGSEDPTLIQQCLNAGCNEFICKPITFEIFAAIIRRYRRESAPQPVKISRMGKKSIDAMVNI